jgi:hypothetical protein
LLSRDLKLARPAEYELIAPKVVEVKRMLTALHKKLSADRRLLKAALSVAPDR